ncbi:MAG: STAS domain-containing protein [Terriglobales bacterium]
MAANPVIRPPEFKLETEKKDSETTIRATGPITLVPSARLENAVRDLIPEGKRIVLDLANVDYIDSAGLGALVSVYMHARRTKCALEIANPTQRIRDLFDRSGLASVFEARSVDTPWEASSNRFELTHE